ncbi:hypothetical protein COCNU_scaffold003798G000020 [Cocos nucifera]|nr:hypothetical protein [Cocos nucifera]
MDPGQWVDTNISYRVPADQLQPESTQRSHSSHDFMFETSFQMFEREFLRRSRPSQVGRRDPSSQTQQSKKKDKTKEKIIAASSRV